MKARILVGVGLSIAIVVGLLRTVPPREVLSHLRSANLGYVGLACLVNFITLVLRSERWRLLLSSFKRLPLWTVMRPYLVGIAVNSVLPFRTGEAVRAYAITRNGLDTTHAISTVLADRSFDAISFGALVIIAAQLIELPAAISVRTYGIALSSVALVASFPIVARFGRAMRQKQEIAHGDGFQQRIAKRLEPLLTGYACLSGRQALVGGLLSLAAWIAQVGVALLVARSVDLDLTLPAVVVAVSAVNAVAAFPLTPGNIGVFQIAFMVALSAYGIDRNAAIAVATILQVALVVPVTAVGLILLNRHNYEIGFGRSRTSSS